tara:strand:+ start:254 stop:475 length:222 start_codon:yes stop_codon:yes gene_type:complete
MTRKEYWEAYYKRFASVIDDLDKVIVANRFDPLGDTDFERGVSRAMQIIASAIMSGEIPSCGGNRVDAQSIAM